MRSMATLQTYRTLAEAVDAADWLMNSREYLFSRDYPQFGSFSKYLDWMRICFVRRLVIEGEEVDAGRPPGSDFRIMYINRTRWSRRKKDLNTAVLVHELTELFLLANDYVLWPRDAHLIAEFFEDDFRKKRGLPQCDVCPLPQEIMPIMRKFEAKLERTIDHLVRYEVGLILNYSLGNKRFHISQH